MIKTKQTETSTKNKLMDAAESLMLSKGYVAATVDEICGEAGLTKGSFFHYFKNKEALGKELVQRFMTRAGEFFAAEIAKLNDDPLDRIYGYLDIMIRASKDPAYKGCLLGTFAQEVSETHPELRHTCEEGFQRMAELFRTDLVKAKAKYQPAVNFEVNGLAELFLTVSQGAHLVVKVKEDRGVMERSIRHLQGYVRFLFGR